MQAFLNFALLLLCWLAALATLLIFLESWFALSSRQKFTGSRASGAYGVVTVFIPMQGSVDKLDRLIRSVLSQTYPFIELVLIYNEDDLRHVNLSREIRGVRTHIAIRGVPTSFPIENETDRIRALEQAHGGVRGRWWVVLSPDVILDRLALESALEFGGSNEVSAMALRPGILCTSWCERLMAPSMEYLLQLMRVVDHRRERSRSVTVDAAMLLMNREAFQVVNRINRMPGILNDAGWTLFSYQTEGLRTFEGDGSRWLWREASIRAWPSYREAERGFGRRSVGLIVASIVIAVVSILGLMRGFSGSIENFGGASILAFSAVSYALMAISYFTCARRLRAAMWFAPLWVIAHVPASILTILEIRNSMRKPQPPSGDSSASRFSREPSRSASDPD